MFGNKRCVPVALFLSDAVGFDAILRGFCVLTRHDLLLHPCNARPFSPSPFPPQIREIYRRLGDSDEDRPPRTHPSFFYRCFLPSALSTNNKLVIFSICCLSSFGNSPSNVHSLITLNVINMKIIM